MMGAPTIRTKTTKGEAPTGPLAAFYKALRAAGCVYCARCHAFMWPDHTEHIRGLAVDWHAPHIVVVGGYGEVRVVDLNEDAADLPAAA